jgi:hypothetical protein
MEKVCQHLKNSVQYFLFLVVLARSDQVFLLWHLKLNNYIDKITSLIEANPEVEKLKPLVEILHNLENEGSDSITESTGGIRVRDLLPRKKSIAVEYLNLVVMKWNHTYEVYFSMQVVQVFISEFNLPFTSTYTHPFM